MGTNAQGDLELASVDDAEVYTRRGLIDTLAAIIDAIGPDRVATLDPTIVYGSYVARAPGQTHDADHADHVYAARFLFAALDNVISAPPVTSYRTYNTRNDHVIWRISNSARR